MDLPSTSGIEDDEVEFCESDSDFDGDLQPPDSKRKYSGSATYGTKFDPSWKQKYPCIEAIKKDPYFFFCTCCVKKVSCRHMGIADVKRHVMGSTHTKASKGAELQSRLSFTSTRNVVQKKVVTLESYSCNLLNL